MIHLQIIKNLVFLARVLKLLPESMSTETDDITTQNGDEEHTHKNNASLRWLMTRMCREARLEAANNPKSSIKVRLFYFGTCATNVIIIILIIIISLIIIIYSSLSHIL